MAVRCMRIRGSANSISISVEAPKTRNEARAPVGEITRWGGRRVNNATATAVGLATGGVLGCNARLREPGSRVRRTERKLCGFRLLESGTTVDKSSE